MANTVNIWPPVATDPAEIHPKAPAPGTALRSHYDECFGCGVDQAGGLRMTAQVVEGHVIRSTFTVGREHQGAPGLAQDRKRVV